MGSEQEWTEHFDEQHQAIYYYNSVTQETTWEDPRKYGNVISIDTSTPHIMADNSYDLAPEEDFKAKSIKLKPNPHTQQSTNKRQVVPVDTKTESDSNPKEIPPGGTQQDYVGLSRIYAIERPYADYASSVKCVLCRVNPDPVQVFYPCQHRCVCNSCIESQQVCAMEDIVKFPNGHCNCPLCGQMIKKILPAAGGREEELYWQWVLEVKPPLPQNFMKGFRHSANIIQKIHIDENIKIAKRKERQAKGGCYACCIIA